MTVGNQGQELTDFAALKRLGVAGISDDAFPLQESVLALEGFRKASEEGMLLALHSEDLSLASCALCSAYADLPEEVMLARNILFAAETGARLHLCHVSTARGVALLEWAKVQGVTVTAEACPHHLLLNEGAVERWGPVAKVKPPLRSEGDRTAVLSALRAGLLNVVATDHAPHAWEEKEEGFEKAPAGIVGLETALPLVHTYCGLPLTEVVRLMALAPARILGLGDRGHLGTGALGDLVILDAGKRSKIEGKDFLSKAKFTPFEGWEVRGEVLATVVGGEVAYQSPGLGNRLRREREAKKEAADIATRSLSRVVGKEEAR
jgi:dihydroorotase